MLLFLQILFWLTVALFVIYFVSIITSAPKGKRPRVDWDRVYAMERDVWGQTFEHAGAPEYSLCPHGIHPRIGCGCRPIPKSLTKPAPTGISTHYEYNPFSNPGYYNIETRNAIAAAIHAITHLGAPSAVEASGYNPFSMPENAYMTNDQVEEVFRRGY